MAETYTLTTGQFTIDLRELGELVSPHIVTDNDNTEQVLGVNEVEDMISSAIEDLPDEDRIGEIVSDHIDYNTDFVTEHDVVDIIRDYCDSEGFGSDSEEINDLRSLVNDMHARMVGMQAEIDFLHEKHVENVERRLSYRIGEAVRYVRATPARLWARVPKFTIIRKAN